MSDFTPAHDRLLRAMAALVHGLTDPAPPGYFLREHIAKFDAALIAIDAPPVETEAMISPPGQGVDDDPTQRLVYLRDLVQRWAADWWRYRFGACRPAHHHERAVSEILGRLTPSPPFEACLLSRTVATLPPPGNEGATAVVSDAVCAAVTCWGREVVGGGKTRAIVYDNGKAWIVIGWFPQ